MAKTTSWRSAFAAALLAGAALGCEEQVTAPGRCPDFCPADTIQLVDTVLTGIVVGDTSIRGFTEPRDMPILVVSDLDSSRSRALVRFQGMPQRWFPTQGDTTSVRVGSLDSMALELRLAQRDTTVSNLRVLVYRIPVTTDTTATFANSDSLFHDSLIVDSIMVADTLRAGGLVRGLIAAPAVTADTTDTLVIALGVALRADTQTVATFFSAQSAFGGVPVTRLYARGLAPRDTFTTTFILAPVFDTYVQDPVPPPPPDNFIVAGNQPAARALLRFTLPASIVDSAVLIRATLLLRLVEPAAGRGQERFRLEVAPIIKDFGGKSILVGDTNAYGVGTLAVGDTGFIAIEMVNVLRLWRGINIDSLPRVVVLRNTDEGTSIEEILAFGSSATPANQPRLHVTYARPLRFGVP